MIGQILGYAFLAMLFFVLAVCAFAPFILSGRISEQEERADKPTPEMVDETVMRR